MVMVPTLSCSSSSSLHLYNLKRCSLLHPSVSLCSSFRPLVVKIENKRFCSKFGVKCSVDYESNGYGAYEDRLLDQQFPRPTEIQWKKELCNFVQIIGTVGSPVQIKKLSSGKALAWSRLAFKKSSTETSWINLTFWDELAQTAFQHVEKGDQIFVSGRLISDTVQNDDGKQQTFFKIVVQQLNFIERSQPSDTLFNDNDSNQAGKPISSHNGSNGGSTEALWQAFFANPMEWWDNRKNKRSPKYPDFKHKDTGEALWIEGRNNPPWVKAQLAILDTKMEPYRNQSSNSQLRGLSIDKFAHHCKLQIPCILCSRLDHIFADEKIDFYTSLLCKNHKIGISSLVYCHVHGKLVDAGGMCEDCMMAMPLQNGCNLDKLGMDVEQYRDGLTSTVSSRTCTCCSKICTVKPIPKLLPLPPIGRSIRTHSKPPLPPSPRNIDSVKKVRNKFSGKVTPQLGNRGDHFSQVGYTEAKIASDTESEFPFSDDEDLNSVLREVIYDKDVIFRRHGRGRTNMDTKSVETNTELVSDSGVEVSLLDQYLQKNENVSCDVKGWISSIGYGLEEINREQSKAKNLILDNRLTEDGNASSRLQPLLQENPSSLAPEPPDDKSCDLGTCQITTPSDEKDAKSSETIETRDDMSGSEYIDGSSVSEIEGESIVDTLKRQLQHDRKSMAKLCKELEAERNASAIAANEAMSMITRLQEEKAALHMEALQYLRLMEEQAEYDKDALDKANELLTEKEKEMQDMEAELDIYRADEEETEIRNNKLEQNRISQKISEIKNSLLDFNAEKDYISQCLQQLERKLIHISVDGKKQNDRNECKTVFENEISDLNLRLEALEADRELLAHILYSLKNGHGLEFIEEVSRQLNELRRAVIDTKR